MPDRTIVTIGGSSGGLHAMQKLVAALPPHPGTAIFLVLHTAPDSSRLALSFPDKIRVDRFHIRLCRRPGQDDALIFPLGPSVAPCRKGLQPWAIENLDHAALRTDEPAAFQKMDRIGYARAAYAQKICEALMGESQMSAHRPVLQHEQPTCETLLNPAAGGCQPVRDLQHENMRITHEEPVDLRHRVEEFVKIADIYALGKTGLLNDLREWRDGRAQNA